MTEVQDSIVRTRGILLLNDLEDLVDFDMSRRSQVDKYELVIGKREKDKNYESSNEVS